jgi:energy-coupling factor transport system substrate-specific component
MSSRSKGLKLVDILVTIVIAIVFGIVYKLWGPAYSLLKFTGLQLEELMYGMWFIAGTVAFLLIRKPGVALLAEVAAASGELLIGSEFGIEALTYGILQGIGIELVFALFGYRKASVGVACLAGLGAAAGSLIMDMTKGYLVDLQTWNLMLYIGFRALGSVIITGIFAYVLVKALEATGVTQLVRPVSSEDYKSLD